MNRSAWATQEGVDQIMLASPIASLGTRYLVFQQSASAFYAHIHEGQRVLALGLYGTIAVAIIGITVSNVRREHAVRRDEAQLGALLHNAHDIIVLVDSDRRVTYVSSAIETVLGRSPVGWTGRAVPSIVHPGDADRLQVFLRTADEGSPRTIRDVRLPDHEGCFRWFDVHASSSSDNPALASTVLTWHEIGERRRLCEELDYQATHDPLTDLYNRAAFIDRLERLANGEKVGSPFVVLYIDLNDFKPINDTYGHVVGDEILRAVSARLCSVTRAADTVSRMGGDEFAVLLPGADGSLARSTADRVLDAIAQPVAGSRKITIGAAVGIAVGKAGTGDPDRALRDADLAMYAAKRRTRGQDAAAD